MVLNGLDWAGIDWDRLTWVEMGKDGLEWVGISWNGLKMDLNRLKWVK